MIEYAWVNLDRKEYVLCSEEHAADAVAFLLERSVTSPERHPWSGERIAVFGDGNDSWPWDKCNARFSPEWQGATNTYPLALEWMRLEGLL